MRRPLPKSLMRLLFLPKLFELRCNAKRVLALAGFISVFTPLLHAQTAKIYVSSKGGARLSAQPDVALTDAKPSTGTTGATFQIDDTVKLQKMHGFGASIMEAGIMTLNTLPPDQQEEVLRALFDAKDGAGFTAMKTPLAGTDFQSAGPWFTYDDTPGDVELTHFSVERDFAPNGVGTYILRARKYGNFALQAPIDYPPDWMLYDVKKHQDIPPKYYPVLAKYFMRYLEEYKKRGIVVDYLSLFNELEAGTSAWLYWNAILDENGGPWAVSPVHGNPDPNIQHPVVIINKITHEITYTGVYYYLAHFSKFVRPGAVRVQTTGKAKGVRVMAFQTPDGGFVVQFLN